MGQNFSYPDPRILSAVKSQIDSTKILVVSKTGCRACTNAKQLLNQLATRTGFLPSIFEIDSYGLLCKNAIMKHLSEQTGVKTVPQIWINGSFVGGNDTIQQLHRQGRLLSLIQKTKKSQTVEDCISQTMKDYIGTNSFLRISTFKADVIPMPFIDNLPIQINRNQFTSKYRNRGAVIYDPFPPSIYENTSAMSYQHNSSSDLIAPISKPYTIDDNKESAFIMTEQTSPPQNIASSQATELNVNWLPTSNEAIVNDMPCIGCRNIPDWVTDEEVIAASWV